MRCRWVFADGSAARDCIARRVVFPRELERYLTSAGFEPVELSDASRSRDDLTGPVAWITARYRGR